MNKLKNIDEKVIKEVIYKIEDSKQNGIILAGLPGSGKSTVLENYVQENNNFITPVIDATPQPSIFYLPNKDLNELYYICMMLKSMITFIQENYSKVLNIYLGFFIKKIDTIMFDLRVMLSTHNYNLNNTRIPKEYVNNPQILLEEFLNLLTHCLNFKNITLVIDNFDKEHSSNNIYQTFLFNTLKDYLRVVVAVSDIKNLNQMANLEKHNTVIYTNYSQNIDTVCNILDAHIMNGNLYLKKPPFNLRIRFIFNDADILKLIEKTNGNLFLMLHAIRIFYSVINYLDKDNYAEALFNILDRDVLIDPSISGIMPVKRKLYLN